MKKKLLKISIVLAILFLIIAVVFFFLMKNTTPETPGAEGGEGDGFTQVEPEVYDASHIVKEIKFLKLNTYDEIKKYADENPVYIQTSDDATVFAIGELYIEDRPVSLFYKLNADNSIKRFDGSYSYEMSDPSASEISRVLSHLDCVVAGCFDYEEFDHSVFGEDGMNINIYDEASYELMLDGKAKYNLSVIDEHNTYWNISAVVIDHKQIKIEFFRCFDLSVYDDDTPNIDLRIEEEGGEGNYEEETEE